MTKGNDGTGNIVGRDDWETPQWLFNLLDHQYEFDFDCCSTRENSKCVNGTHNFEEIKQDFLDWKCWMNPPFTKAKEMFEHFFKVVRKGVAIYRCDNMETKVWQEIILKHADWIFIPKGRIAYQYNPDLRGGKGSRFPSALIGIGIPPIHQNEMLNGILLKVSK